MKIAIIAGEASGDILGSRLIQSLKIYYPDATFEGIGGREMLAQGFESHYSMERLSVMGFAEVFSRLFELLKMRGSLITKWLANPPDIFIGIDAPDFNLKLEKALYQAGISTVHYVSPSVWAWRENRVKKMKNAMDLMLTLFPFEVSFYEKHQIPAKFVGHPLADEIAINVDQKVARNELNLPEKCFILGVLPGSRMGEIKRIAPDFLEGLTQIKRKYPDWEFVVPVINEEIKQAFLAVKQEIAPDLAMHYINGQSRTVMAASDEAELAHMVTTAAHHDDGPLWRRWAMTTMMGHTMSHACKQSLSLTSLMLLLFSSSAAFPTRKLGSPSPAVFFLSADDMIGV